MTEHGSREEPQFFSLYELPWKQEREIGAVYGCEVRTLSRDDISGAATFMARAPSGWSVSAGFDEGTTEVFVLEGDLALNGDTVGAGGFVAIPRTERAVELTSKTGCHALVYWNPAVEPTDYYDGEFQVRKSWKEEWIMANLPGSIHGRMYKPMRIPDPVSDVVTGGPAGLLHLVLQVPGFHYPHEEYHYEAWEEIIVLNGDNLMPGRGYYGHGTYISNPAGYKHGLYMTQRGTLLLRHTNRPIDFVPVPFEPGEKLIEYYFDHSSLLGAPETESWSERPERRLLEKTGSASP